MVDYYDDQRNPHLTELFLHPCDFLKGTHSNTEIAEQASNFSNSDQEDDKIDKNFFMHICILADPVDDQKAGIHVYTREIIENLLKIDKKNRYSFIHKRANNYFEELTKQHPQSRHHIVPHHSFPSAGTYRKFFAIPKLLKEIKPDLVFEPCHIGPFRIKKGCKKVLAVHDLTPIIMPAHHTKRSVIVHKLLFKRSIKNADLVITPSKNSKKDIEAYCQKTAKVIALGCSQQSASSQDPKLIQILKTGRPPQEAKEPTKRIIKSPYLLYLGTIEPRKNIETLIKAFSKISNQIPHKLILAGAIGWKSKKIEEKINQNGRIEQLQYIDEATKSNLYRYADAFIYPSLYEGFGLPPLEAMSHKVPVIIAKNSSLEEYFSEHAETFATTSSEELAEKILQLLTNPKSRQALANRGYRYSQNFSWEKCARETLKAFEELK